jgi:hypothetical protein
MPVAMSHKGYSNKAKSGANALRARLHQEAERAKRERAQPRVKKARKRRDPKT